jgi:hypothetical protein
LTVAPPPAPGRALAWIGMGLAVYAWLLLGLDWFLHGAALPEGPARGLAMFRRLVMGRAVVLLGAGATVAALVLAIRALRRRPRVAAATLVLAIAWTAAAVWTLLSGRV